MVGKTVGCQLFVFGARPTIIGVRIDADAATRSKEACHLNILGLHQFDQVFHDDVHTIFVEIAMVAKTEQIEFKALAFHHALGRNITDAYLCKVGLSGDGAQRGEFGTVEPYPIVVVGMFVLKSCNYCVLIVHALCGLGTKRLQALIFSVVKFHISVSVNAYFSIDTWCVLFIPTIYFTFVCFSSFACYLIKANE